MGNLLPSALRDRSGPGQAVAVWLRGRCQIFFPLAAGVAAAQRACDTNVGVPHLGWLRGGLVVMSATSAVTATSNNQHTGTYLWNVSRLSP